MFHKTRSECSVDHARGLVFHRPQAASHRRAVVYFCSAVLTCWVARVARASPGLGRDWLGQPRLLGRAPHAGRAAKPAPEEWQKYEGVGAANNLTHFS